MQAVLAMGSIILSPSPLYEVFGRLLLEPLCTTAFPSLSVDQILIPFDQIPVFVIFPIKIYVNIHPGVPGEHINLDIYVLDIFLT